MIVVESYEHYDMFIVIVVDKGVEERVKEEDVPLKVFQLSEDYIEDEVEWDHFNIDGELMDSETLGVEDFLVRFGTSTKEEVM